MALLHWGPAATFLLCSDMRLSDLPGGHTYKLNLRTDSNLDGINYQAVFTPAPGLWTQTVLPLAAFEPSFRGRFVHGAPPLKPEAVRQVGLMISDKQVGPFRLMVKTIEALAHGWLVSTSMSMTMDRAWVVYLMPVPALVLLAL